MNGKRIGGIACFVLAAAFLASGINAISRQALPVGDASGLGVSRAVGTFLPALVALGVGLWLFQRPGRS